MDFERNIRVGKSWPREATPTALTPNWEGEFVNFDDWVHFAANRLTACVGSVGQSVPPICVDALGRRCHCGKDFARARDEGTFPVRYFFECVEPSPLHAAAGDLLAACKGMIEAYWRGSEDSSDEDAPSMVKDALAAIARAEGA